jgi:hypothetical protein
MLAEVESHKQISFKGMTQDEKETFLDSLVSNGYNHDITLDIFDMGLLVDIETKTIIRVMSKTLDYQPGVGPIETIRAQRFL